MKPRLPMLLSFILVFVASACPCEKGTYVCEGDQGYHRGPFNGSCPGECDRDESCRECSGFAPTNPPPINVLLTRTGTSLDITINEPGPLTTLGLVRLTGDDPGGIVLKGTLDCQDCTELGDLLSFIAGQVAGDNRTMPEALAGLYVRLPEIDVEIKPDGLIKVTSGFGTVKLRVSEVTRHGHVLIRPVRFHGAPALRSRDFVTTGRWLENQVLQFYGTSTATGN